VSTSQGPEQVPPWCLFKNSHFGGKQKMGSGNSRLPAIKTKPQTDRPLSAQKKKLSREPTACRP
jgi:hypothetical protein